MYPNSVQKLSFMAKGTPSSGPREVPEAKRFAAALAAEYATSWYISLKHPCNDACAAVIEDAVSAWAEISDDRKRFARDFSDRDAGIQYTKCKPLAVIVSNPN